jgi:hypothetical protein
VETLHLSLIAVVVYSGTYKEKPISPPPEYQTFFPKHSWSSKY